MIEQLSLKFHGSVSCLSLCKILHQTLSPVLNDGHVAVAYADFEGSFLQPYNPYVTDVIVEKESDHYIVIESNNLPMKNTALRRSDIQGDLFPTLVPGHQNECYLIGRYGTLYIVMNKQTGSSAENAITFSKSCKNTVIIGSPSAGVGLFGEVRPYQLTNSGIFVLLPYKLFYEDDFEIGKGKYPDYWIDNENPVEYLLKCIDDR